MKIRAIHLILTLFACLGLGLAPAGAAERFPVTVEVDFGPSGQDRIVSELEIGPGETPNSVLKKVCNVKNSFVCCGPMDVSMVNDVAVSPGAHMWWVVTLNDSRDVNPHRTELKAHDRVVWKYLYEKYDPEKAARGKTAKR